MMRPNFLIAKTHLVTKKGQTVVAMLGVTFGIAMFLAMMGLMTGVNKFLEETTLSATPHIHIYNDIKTERENIIDELYPKDFRVTYHQKPKEEGQNLLNARAIIEKAAKDPEVLGVSPLTSAQVFYNYGAHQLNGQLYGVNILEENKLFDLRSKMKEGKLEDVMSANDGLIIGSGLAKKMNLHKGDKLQITTAKGVTMLLQVVGVIQQGIAQIDNTRSYANLNLVQGLLGEGNGYITDVNMKLKDLNHAPVVGARYEKLFGYRAEDWETANATILISFTLRNVITGAVVIALLTVAGFGIYNIMSMTIYNKMKDIAILKAMGFQSKDIRSIFMMEALAIGFLGGVSGLIIGTAMQIGLSKIPFDGGDVLSLRHLPINFNPMFQVVGLTFSLITTAFAGYFPSRKAGKIDPVVIIRG